MPIQPRRFFWPVREMAFHVTKSGRSCSTGRAGRLGRRIENSDERDEFDEDDARVDTGVRELDVDVDDGVEDDEAEVDDGLGTARRFGLKRVVGPRMGSSSGSEASSSSAPSPPSLSSTSMTSSASYSTSVSTRRVGWYDPHSS